MADEFEAEATGGAGDEVTRHFGFGFLLTDGVWWDLNFTIYDLGLGVWPDGMEWNAREEVGREFKGECNVRVTDGVAASFFRLFVLQQQRGRRRRRPDVLNTVEICICVRFKVEQKRRVMYVASDLRHSLCPIRSFPSMDQKCQHKL